MGGEGGDDVNMYGGTWNYIEGFGVIDIGY